MTQAKNVQRKSAGLFAALAALSVALASPASAKELSLAYFMGPKHPMNKAVFTPFANKLKEVSGGKLTVKQYPAGALNSSAPKQYSILLKGVADIAFALPGYTARLFPVGSAITAPGVCGSATECTAALWRVMPLLEKEVNAKILAYWSNDVPVLITKDSQVTTMEQLKGLKVRVTSAQDAPFTEALGAAAVSQPVPVINRNLANGTIDAITIDPSAVRSFKLHEPANFITTGYPGSGSSFLLAMNWDVYNGLSKQEQEWVNQASGKWLSESGGAMYEKAAKGGLKLAAQKGVKITQFSAAEQAKMNKAIAPALGKFRARQLKDGQTLGDVVDMMMGKK